MAELIYLDIETIPTQSERIMSLMRDEVQADVQARIDELAEEMANVQAPGNIKDPDKIAEAIAKKRANLAADIAEERAAAADTFDKAYRATSLDGAFGQVAVCSIAADDEDPIAFFEEDWRHPFAERNLLKRINDALQDICGRSRGVTLVGHNIIGFDRKFLRQRGIINGIRMHPLLTKEVKPWENSLVFDTMVAWSGDIRDKASMNKLCRAFNLPDKGDIDGSQVWDYVAAGRIAEVAAYCNGDVVRTRQLYKVINLLQPVVEQDFDLQDVPL